MINKEHAIKILKQALEYEEKQLAECRANIKSLKERTVKDENFVVENMASIEGLKDAIHKLSGLDNLEEKNIEEKRPASMQKNLIRTETAELYGRSIASYSKRELAAYIIHQSDKISKMLEAKK